MYYYGESYFTSSWVIFFSFLYTFAELVFDLCSGPMNKKLGSRFPIILAGQVLVISSIILIVEKSIYIVLFYYILFFFSFGVDYLIVIDNCCKYYSNYKTLVLGVIESASTLFESLVLLLGEFLINPDGKPENEDTLLYDKDVADNIWKF